MAEHGEDCKWAHEHTNRVDARTAFDKDFRHLRAPVDRRIMQCSPVVFIYRLLEDGVDLKSSSGTYR
jgi:hypothetical protein